MLALRQVDLGPGVHARAGRDEITHQRQRCAAEVSVLIHVQVFADAENDTPATTAARQQNTLRHVLMVLIFPLWS